MFQEIAIEDIKENVFDKIGKEWMLISAGDKEHHNAMTASWGGMGVLWKKNVVTIYVRPQRYTKQLMDEQSHFALSFYDESMRSMLSYMGSVSGKDENKSDACHLHVAYDHAPYYEEAKEVWICRKLYAQPMDPECFITDEIERTCYPQKDFHIIYVGEIEKILRRTNV